MKFALAKYVKLVREFPVVVVTFGLWMVCLILNILDSIQGRTRS